MKAESKQFISPYKEVPQGRWIGVTEQLLKEHPLKANVIKDIITEAWKIVWTSQIGDKNFNFILKEFNPHATIIGYLLEKVVSKLLQKRFPNEWSGGENGSEKTFTLALTRNFLSK